jgi:hypothetical protein
MHDGGEATGDVAKQIPADKYAETVQEFFLG